MPNTSSTGCDAIEQDVQEACTGTPTNVSVSTFTLLSSVSDAETQSTASQRKPDVSQIVREAIAGELESLIPSLRESMMKPQGIIHDGISCSICKISPIVGSRYYCTTCDFDICESCEPEHMCNLIKYKTQSVV